MQGRRRDQVVAASRQRRGASVCRARCAFTFLTLRFAGKLNQKLS